MKTFWLTGEKFDESKTDSSRSKKITIDEGIDEVEEITFTFLSLFFLRISLCFSSYFLLLFSFSWSVAGPRAILRKEKVVRQLNT